MCLRTLLLVMGVILMFQPKRLQAQSRYVTCSHQQFPVNNKPWYFIGTNYWYGGLLPINLKGRETDACTWNII